MGLFIFSALSVSNPVIQLLNQNRPLVMGILNTTPDSFSDGGQFEGVEYALHHAKTMIEQGCDIVDIGGESTRPGAQPVSLVDELDRVIPVIQAIRGISDIAISVDTSKPEVMTAAVKAGANLVNDVNALSAEGAVDTCAAMQIPVCVMHMQGEPRTMQTEPVYQNVVEDIKRFLEERVAVCEVAGISREHIIIDPGFGFGKTLEHNLTLLKHLDQFAETQLPILVGISRKTMIGKILEARVDQRLYGSVAAAVLAYTKGAKIFRVHDVKATVDALKICKAMSDSH